MKKTTGRKLELNTAVIGSLRQTLSQEQLAAAAGAIQPRETRQSNSGITPPLYC